MSKITEYAILGERCTGTNYLQKLMENNFHLKKTDRFGHKHFFGFSDYKDSDNVLFIGIVRDPFQWLGSINKKKYHFAYHLRKNMRILLTQPYFSVYDSKVDHGEKFGHEIMEDRHIYTHKRYRNIIDLRNTKNYFLVKDMPKKVKNYILIRYEDLSKHTFRELEKIQTQFSIERKNTEFVNFLKHTKLKTVNWEKNHEVYVPNLKNFNLVRKMIDINIEHYLGYLNHIPNTSEKKLMDESPFESLNPQEVVIEGE